MRIDIVPFENIQNAILVTMVGMWNEPDVSKLADDIDRIKPQYLLLDPTDVIIGRGQRKPIEESSTARQTGALTIAKLMQDNPKMLFIVINRNSNPVLMTGVSLYQKMGVGDRYIFVKSEDEALSIINEWDATGS